MRPAKPTDIGRVGYVVKRYPRYSETFIVNEILAHEKAGLKIDIFSLRPPVDTHFQNTISQVVAPVHYLPSQGAKADAFWDAIKEAVSLHADDDWSVLETAAGARGADVYQAILLARCVRNRGIRHLHAHFASASATIARLAARLAGISYSLTAHAKDIFHEDVDTDELACKLNDASAVVTVSDFNVRFLADRYGTTANNVHRIYNGMDLETLSYDPPSRRPTQPGQPPRIVAIGRLVEKKGFADLVDACELLKRRGCDFRCSIIGHGELELELRQRVKRLGLDDCVTLTGPRPQSEVLQIIRESTLLAAPCVVGNDGNRDGLPTVLVEAMSLGTPCISTDVTGIPEVLRDNETGLLVPQRDPETLSNAIERLLGDTAMQNTIADNARRLMEAEFDVHRNAERIRDLFRSGDRDCVATQPANKLHAIH